MPKDSYNLLEKVEFKIRGFLSHYPTVYALIVGIGIIVFWRGVWHSVDALHLIYFRYLYGPASTTDLSALPWWDGPLSLIVGAIILLAAGAFVSSFIGNEIIISGLRGEKRLTEKAETEMRHEVGAIADIKAEVQEIREHLHHLEDKLK